MAKLLYRMVQIAGIIACSLTISRIGVIGLTVGSGEFAAVLLSFGVIAWCSFHLLKD